MKNVIIKIVHHRNKFAIQTLLISRYLISVKVKLMNSLSLKNLFDSLHKPSSHLVTPDTNHSIVQGRKKSDNVRTGYTKQVNIYNKGNYKVDPP